VVNTGSPGAPPAGNAAAEARIWSLLSEVPDPEIPVLNVLDLGIVRGVSIEATNVTVAVAPTYSACPAVEVIENSIASKLLANGFANVLVKRVIAPPWTTDWISEAGRDKLRRYGIAPPPAGSAKRALLGNGLPVCCPRCRSGDTVCTSEFGSTPCKSAYRCDACREPFEYFKCI
jgi:ring-1,2-phenylacetyl-CoA epoxidase subunit PaaD